MTEYRAIYKCRLCGGKFVSASTSSSDVAIENMLNVTVGYEIKEWIGNPATETTMHSCKDGSMGLEDFLGFRKVEE